MDGLCKIFETHLKQKNPTSRNITYDVKDLFSYIDNLPDLGILVYVYMLDRVRFSSQVLVVVCFR